jgi:hypothetical protein
VRDRHVVYGINGCWKQFPDAEEHTIYLAEPLRNDPS